VFADDTLRQLLRCVRERRTLAAVDPFARRLLHRAIHLTNRRFETEDGPVSAGTLGLLLVRNVADGIHEDIDVTSWPHAGCI